MPDIALKKYISDFNSFWILFFTVFIAMLGLGIIAPILPLLGKRLGASGIFLGLIFSGFSMARVLFMPIVGHQADKRGRKIFLITGLIFYALISFTYTLATSPTQLLLMRILQGMASAMVIPVAMAYVGDKAQKGKEGEVMGTFSLSIVIGTGVGPLLGGFITDFGGEYAPFYTLSGLALVSAFFCFFFLKNDSGYSHDNRNSLRKTLVQIIHDKEFAAVLFYRITMTLGRGGILSFFPIFALKYNMPLSQIGILISTNFIVMSFFQKPFGKLADSWSRKLQIASGMLIAAFSLVLFYWLHGFWPMLFLNMMIGLAGSLAYPPAVAIAVEKGRIYGMSSSMSVFNSAMSTGMVAAPLISGFIMDYLGIDHVFTVTGAMLLICTIIFYYWAKDTKHPNSAKVRISSN